MNGQPSMLPHGHPGCPMGAPQPALGHAQQAPLPGPAQCYPHYGLPPFSPHMGMGMGMGMMGIGMPPYGFSPYGQWTGAWCFGQSAIATALSSPERRTTGRRNMAQKQQKHVQLRT